MRFYQIKSTEKDTRPARWYRTLVPSGITFSQLYVLLAYIHDELFGLSLYYEYDTTDMEIHIEEFFDGEPEHGAGFRDIYDTCGTYIDTFFKEGFRISQITGRDFDLTIEVEKDAEDYPEDDYWKYLENVIQKDKPFYIPSRSEIEEYYEKECLLSSSSHQAMYRFLVNRLGFEPKQAELKVMEIYHRINMEERMQEVIDSLMDDIGEDGGFTDEKVFETFVRLYSDMNNFSHIIANRGCSPNDLFNAMGGMRNLPKDMMISPRGPEAAVMLDGARDELAKRGIKIDEDRIDEMLGGEKRRKIDRNEPCPCGSGKKYKNCCGKN